MDSSREDGMSQQKLIAIIGPTAAGKTDIAVKLAKKLNGYIISADSRQMYKYFDIGTAKPKAESILGQKVCQATVNTRERPGREANFLAYSGIPHYFTDFLEPHQTYSAGQFKKDALALIRKNKGLPILVGGTPLYVSAITQNLELPEVEPDQKLRNELEKLSTSELQKKLRKHDKDCFEFIDANNKRRLIRALEIILKTGKKFSKIRKKGTPIFDQSITFLNPPILELKQKIEKRTKAMLKHGLVEETKSLLKRYPKICPPWSSIGYKQVLEYLEGKIPLERLEYEINKATLRYAKRQIAWFKKENQC